MHSSSPTERLHRPAAGARFLPQRPRPARRCEITGADRGPSRLRLLAENARFPTSSADTDRLLGPKAEHIPLMGDQDRGQAPLPPGFGIPASRLGRRDHEERRRQIARRDRLIRAGQGGGGRRRARHAGWPNSADDLADALAGGEARSEDGVRRRPSISRSISPNRATLSSRCSAT